MIVIVKQRDGEDLFIEDVAAVVRPGNGSLRLCRDGHADEWIDDNTNVVVVNDG